jgi:hypothetical protein
VTEDRERSGWFADPAGVHAQRYWDGSAWTNYVADAEGATSVDHLDAAHEAASTSLASTRYASGDGASTGPRVDNRRVSDRASPRISRQHVALVSALAFACVWGAIVTRSLPFLILDSALVLIAVPILWAARRPPR